MARPSLFAALPPLGIAAALATPFACTDKPDAAETAKSETKAETPASKTGAKVEADPAKPAAKALGATGMTKVVADGVAAAATGGRLDRSQALGHIVMPNPAGFLDEVRTKAAPASGAAFLNEGTLRTIAGSQLGARSGLAQHIALDQPIGCVLVEDTASDIPVACMMGYIGGAAALATDLGDQGKQADAQGHAAYYRVDGEDVFVDELDGKVVMSNHAAVFAKAKDYLQTNMIARASSITDDIEVVVYPKAGMARYSELVDELLAATRSAAPSATGDPVADAFTEYSRTSMDNSFNFYRETDQMELGLGLEEIGLVMRYAMHPTPGSSIQSDSKSISAGPMDPALAGQLPAESWMVFAATADWKAAFSTESGEPMRAALIDAYATVTGNDAAAVRASVAAFVEEGARLYANDFTMGLAHLPGTQGGLILSRKLNEASRASWKTWSESFVADTVLGAEGIKYVGWTFEPDALEVDGVAVDRWTIEPGPETKAEIAKKKDPAIAEIERRFGGLKLVIDRVELEDRVMYVMAPGASEEYIRAAILAAKGGPGTGTDPGLKALLARNASTSAVMAVDVGGAMGWLREVMPAEATRKIPPGLGNDLGDLYFAAQYGASGTMRGEMVLSQAMIEQLRALGG